MGPEMAIDVASWLQQLGLAQYEPAFRDNEVDGDVLPDLTADDLIAIGVTAVGHRRKLLSAIAALGAAAPAPAPTATPASVPPPTPAPAQAERRQLTVMFCDLVGSTALSTGMDPEELRDVIASFQNRCSAAIRRYDGFVAIPGLLGAGPRTDALFPVAPPTTPVPRQRVRAH